MRRATKILESAQAMDADLIVVGSRGHGTIASMVLGSVAAEVADLAECPVLVARGSELNRIVLGVDDSEFSRMAESLISDWAIFADAAVEVTHVVQRTLPWIVGLAPGVYVPPDTGAEEREVATSATERLSRAGRRAFGRTLGGDPAAGLIATAREIGADLIVVGTHGRTGLNRAVFGSVARNVMLHAPCSVLIVRKLRQPAEQVKAA
jgi:nucleotide-binding universal stress UspA family protein